MRKQRLGQIGDYWLSQQKNSDKWYRTWYDSESRQTRRASLGTSDFREAQLELARWVTTESDIRNAPEDELELATVLVRYYEHHGKHTASEEMARIALRKWNDFFGSAMVSDVRPKRVEAFTRHLKDEGASGSYARRVLSVGRAALNYAYKNGEIRSVPFIPTPSKTVERQRDRVLTLDETAALFNAAKQEHHVMFLLLAFNTLARPGAILDLTRFQVDFERRLITLNPQGREQTKKHRPVVPITATLLPHLRNAKADYFVNWKGRPITNILKGFKAVAKRAGLDSEVIPYTPRHTMASELRARGVSEWELAGLMGHRVAGETERYAKFDPRRTEAAVQAIDDYFSELQPKVNKRLVIGAVRTSCVLIGK